MMNRKETYEAENFLSDSLPEGTSWSIRRSERKNFWYVEIIDPSIQTNTSILHPCSFHEDVMIASESALDKWKKNEKPRYSDYKDARFQIDVRDDIIGHGRIKTKQV